VKAPPVELAQSTAKTTIRFSILPTLPSDRRNRGDDAAWRARRDARAAVDAECLRRSAFDLLVFVLPASGTSDLARDLVNPLLSHHGLLDYRVCEQVFCSE